MKVAAAQIECRPGRIADNLAMHLSIIGEARAAGIDLLVFPELSLTDYLSRPDLPTLARPRHCREIHAIAEAAGPMPVSVGFIEADPSGLFFNAQALVSGRGVIHVHRKINLPTYGQLVEGEVYSPGREIKVADIAGLGHIATLICADSWNPALPFVAALQE